MKWLLALVAIPIVVAIVTADVHRSRRRREHLDRLQADRSPLPIADFAAACDVTGDIAVRIRRILAAVSEEAHSPPRRPVDPERLRPEDDLCLDLGYDLDSLSHLELLHRLEREFGVAFRWQELLPNKPQPLTVRDLTRVVAARLDAHLPLGSRGATTDKKEDVLAPKKTTF